MFIGVTARFTDRYSETTNVVINVAMALSLEHGVIIQSNLLYGTQVALYSAADLKWAHFKSAAE